MELLSKLEISEKLKQIDLKSTNQRVAIYEAILPMENHPSAELIYAKIREDNPSITLATVYNTLETFAKSGLINKISSSNGKLRYDPNTKPHNHICCENTDDIYDFYDEKLNKVLTKLIASKNIENFEFKDFRLLIKGNKIDKNQNIEIK